LTCISIGISPISSRNRVPWSASSKRPGFDPTAPVKAPFSYPKSSDSISVLGIAAQLILMNGPFRRDELLCSARAISSFPVPDSPVISTVEGVSATFSITAKICSSTGEWPMSP
jgi:hypothetical protein